MVAVIKKSFSDVPKISLPLTIILLVASLVGVQVGIFLVRRISGAGFRRYFIYVLIAAITMIAFDLVGTLL
ncbi:MAG: hypothetical protein U5P10_07400 [Spirochaetia bacterium]|nr:hypothetical protein [Spirochaetia bacterium]